MKLRRKVTVIGAVALALMLAGTAFAAPMIFTSKTAWQSAVGGPYKTELFSDGTFEDFGVVSEYPGIGHVQYGYWYDRVSSGGDYSTTWTFNSPIYAFGGDFDLGNPGGPGEGISVFVNGSWNYIGEIDRYQTGFWGFVCDELFTAVRFDGADIVSGVETYTLDNLMYSFGLCIDIKPGSYPNSISLTDNGVLPVAFLGTAEFDVTMIDPESIMIGGVGLMMKRNGDLMYSFEDVNEDGWMDLACKFSIPELVAAGELDQCTTELTIVCDKGVGADTVRIVPED